MLWYLSLCLGTRRFIQIYSNLLWPIYSWNFLSAFCQGKKTREIAAASSMTLNSQPCISQWRCRCPKGRIFYLEVRCIKVAKSQKNIFIFIPHTKICVKSLSLIFSTFYFFNFTQFLLASELLILKERIWLKRNWSEFTN